MKTKIANIKKLKPNWYLIDAKEEVLGRLASKVAIFLRGKHKAEYTPFLDTGDFIIIINAEKIKVTGKKYNNKTYYNFSGYPGGLKKIVFKDLLKKTPSKIIFRAVKGMIPKNPLGRKMIKKLKIYEGNQHPHQAQSPKKLKVSSD